VIHESEIPGPDSAVVVHRAEQIVQSRRLLLSIAERLMSDAMRSQATASDVVQQTLLAAIRDQASFRGSSEQELTQWLIQILKHRIIDEARRIEVRREHMPLKSKTTLQIQQSMNQPTLLSDLVAQETIHQLLHAIQHLEPQQQSIVQLRYIESLSFDRIGERMNLSHDAVRRLWLKAMQSLGRQLGAESER
jgi:RNA polymerase sigma factor (sigma-70 family)